MLLLSPNPAAPPPYEQRFVFTLDFSEPGSVLPEATPAASMLVQVRR
jgi:hypothetical protein